MERSWLVHVDDMLRATEYIARLMDRVPGDGAHASDDVSDALLYNLIVLGKGAEQIPADIKSRYPNIDWDGLAASASAALRDYRTFDTSACWQTIAARLPALVQALMQLSKSDVDASKVARRRNTPGHGGPRRNQVLGTLRQHQGELTALRVRRLCLFGSVARDDAGPASDVDLLVEFSEPVGYFHVFHVQARLEALLGYPVDLVSQDGLKPRIRERVLREAIPIA